jgi:hemerythrin-like domain-containing protein
MGWDDSPIARIRRDHDLERYLMRSLRHAALQAEDWSSYDREHFLAVARELIAFSRAHAEAEERLLFPEAKRRLSGAARESLAADFARLDAQRGDDGSPEALRALGQALITSYGRVG